MAKHSPADEFDEYARSIEHQGGSISAKVRWPEGVEEAYWSCIDAIIEQRTSASATILSRWMKAKYGDLRGISDSSVRNDIRERREAKDGQEEAG